MHGERRSGYAPVGVCTGALPQPDCQFMGKGDRGMHRSGYARGHYPNPTVNSWGKAIGVSTGRGMHGGITPTF